MGRIPVRLRALLVMLLIMTPERPSPAQTCETAGGSFLCGVTDNLLSRTSSEQRDSLQIFNHIELSRGQRLLGASLKWSLRGHEDRSGIYIMAKHELIQTPRPATGRISNSLSSQLDRNTLNSFIIGWDTVEASRYMAVSIGRQWSVRTNAGQTLLYGKSQAPILSATYIDRWRDGWMLVAQTDVDALLRGFNLKTSVQTEIGDEMMLGPEVMIYQDKSFQRQRLGAVLGGLRMMGTDYTLSIGAERDTLSHRGMFSTIMAARRF